MTSPEQSPEPLRPHDPLVEREHAQAAIVGQGSAPARPAIEYRVARVSSVTGLSVGVTIALQLAAVPICLRAWGQETYGTWLTLFASYTIMRTLDGGYASFVGNKLNVLYHRDQDELRRVMASAVAGVAVLGALQLMAVALLYATNTMDLLLGANPGRRALGEITLGLVVLSVSWIGTGSYIGIVHRLMVPAGFMYQAAWWAMGFQVTQYASLVLAAVLGFSVLQAACLMAAVQAVIYVASAAWMRVRLPAYYPWWRGARCKLGLADVVRSIPLTMSGILQQGSNGGLVLLISSMLGPAFVPAFTTLRTLTNLWTTLVNVATGPLLPEVVRFHATGDGTKLEGIHRAHALLVSALVNVSILVAYPFLDVVHGYWTRHRLPFDAGLMALLLAGTAIAGLNALMTMLLTGLNHATFVVASAALRGGIMMGLGVALLPRVGVAGIGIAVLVGEGLLVVLTQQWFFRRELRKLGRTGSFVPPWPMVGTAALVAFLTASAWGTHQVGVAYVATWVVCVASVVLGWRHLDPEVRRRMKGLVRQMIPFVGRAA